MSRVPSHSDVSSISRDNWESLCAVICGLVFDTHRVEDRMGRGNGLDAWRVSDGAVEGWQFRRLDGRLGANQIAKLKENIKLAATRTPNELGAPLAKFTAILNIDPQPGHAGSTGEIEQLRKLCEWASTEHSVNFEFKGVSWVHRHLLQNPWMCPQLFEDLAASVNAATEAALRVERQVSELSARIDPTLEAQLQEKLQVLLKEAEEHHKRGFELGRGEDYLRSITSWEDALRLVRGHGGVPRFEGKILSVLGGVRVMVGQLSTANENSRRAVALLDPVEDAEHYWWALGNLAFGLTHAQEYVEAEQLFPTVLEHYEGDGQLMEIARTVQQMIELAVASKKQPSTLHTLVARLVSLQHALLEAEGPSELTLGFLGTIGNAYRYQSSTAPEGTGRTLLELALATYERLAQVAQAVGRRRLVLMAQGQIGFCLWHLDRLEEADAAFQNAIAADDGTFGKVVADIQFNRGLLLGEMSRIGDARASLQSALRSYLALGDRASAHDAEHQLARLGGA